MPAFAFPAFLPRIVSRLPVTPPSFAFCLAANRMLWPTMRRLDWRPLAGRRFAIRVKDLGLCLRFTLGERGFSPDARAEADLTISADARDFFLLVTRREDPDTLFFSRRLISEGDTELGLAAKNLLDAIDPEDVFRRMPVPVARLARAAM